MDCTHARPSPNRNHLRRDEILGTIGTRYSAGVKLFVGLDARGLQQLLHEGFIDPEARQNGGPRAREYLRFMQRWPVARAHGYAVTRRREDYRVVLEGLECDLRGMPAGHTDQLRSEFELFSRRADEYHADDGWLRATWDEPSPRPPAGRASRAQNAPVKLSPTPPGPGPRRATGPTVAPR
jgi:hypothetical protein